MLTALGPFRPVLIAALLMMVGQGVMNSILPVRLAQLDASAQIAGLLTTVYFLGQMIGTRLGHWLLHRTGHIRAFAAMIAATGVCTLLAAMIEDPWVWMLLRLAMGVFTVLAILVMESWLNMASENSVRGSVFGAYMVVVYLGLTGGQSIIGLFDTSTFVPFSIAAMALMLAILPMTMTERAQPELLPTTRVRLVDLLRISPVGIVSSIASGALTGTMFGLFPFYAASVGLSPSGIATFMAAVIGGGLLLNWPLGKLSDMIDRRLVIGACSITIVITSITLAMSATSLLTLVFAGGVMGGATAALYSLSAAHTNDYLGGIDAVAVGAGLLMAFGIGAIAGPMIASALMDMAAPVALFVYTGVVGAMLAMLALVRIVIQPAVGSGEKTDFVALSRTAAVPLAMDPGTPEEETDGQMVATEPQY